MHPMPGHVEDDDTMNNFWSKFPKVLAKIRADARDPAQVIREFFASLKAIVAAFEDNPDINGDIEIVSDCADCDLGMFNYLLKELNDIADRDVVSGDPEGTRMDLESVPPVSNTNLRMLGTAGRYHRARDPGERLDALGLEEECEKWIKATYPGVEHTHDPLMDAEHSYYQMVYLNTQVKQ
jgi:hypothetical protein